MTIPVWLLLYHDLVGLVFILALVYWTLGLHDRMTARYREQAKAMGDHQALDARHREQIDNQASRLATLTEANLKLEGEKAVLLERLRNREITQAELDMLNQARAAGGAAAVTINAGGDVTVGELTGRDQTRSA